MRNSLRSSLLTSPELSLVLVSDLQTRLLAAMPDQSRLIAQCRLLLRGAKLLDVPVVGTEQYPQGLGRTLPEIAEFLPDPPEKLRFSCVEALQLPPVAERTDGRSRVVLLGIETHVCILQTAFDLQSLGYEVLLPVDALSSQQEIDHVTALRRMETAGMTLTTVQSLLFEWCETAAHPHFKTLSRLVTGRE